MTSLSKLFLGVETGLTGLLALGAGLLTVSEAVIRYLSPASLPDWSAEVTVYLIGWAVMLSASRLIRDRMHVSVDMVIEHLSPRALRGAEIFTCVFGILVSAGIVYAGLKMVDFALMFGERSDSSIRFPMWGYYAAIPVGFGLCAAQYAIQLVSLLRPRGTSC
jgi:C4-dicarboxylate transporter DctQ subunit